MGCRPSVVKSDTGPLGNGDVSRTSGDKRNGSATTKSRRESRRNSKNQEYSMMANEEGYVSTGLDAEISDAPVSRIPSVLALPNDVAAQKDADAPEPDVQEDVNTEEEREDRTDNNERREAQEPDNPVNEAEKKEEGDFIVGINDDDDVEHVHAATVLQAAFRGQQVRKSISPSDRKMSTPNAQPASARSAADSLQSAKASEKGGEEVDIDLEDPDVEKAALKIQGAFKGLKSRKTPSPASSESSASSAGKT